MHSFANRVALITGAASGIGRQLARTLSSEGAAIAAIDLQSEPLEHLAAELAGKRFAWAIADVTDRAALREAVGKLHEQVGPTDLLIASAGIGYATSALEFHVEEFEAHIRVNLIGVANSFDAVLPSMLARRQGHLVAISSLASYRGLPRMAGYCASKAGVNALLDAFRMELKPQGIAVTTICPGWIRTPMTANLDMELPHLMEVEDAARRIVDSIRRGRSFDAFPRPSARRVRVLRWLPCPISDWLAARALRNLEKK
jgi:NAD(P)-dependent dehydrogenase (short-subunit alcohol dehydrogenase family)